MEYGGQIVKPGDEPQVVISTMTMTIMVLVPCCAHWSRAGGTVVYLCDVMGIYMLHKKVLSTGTLVWEVQIYLTKINLFLCGFEHHVYVALVEKFVQGST